MSAPEDDPRDDISAEEYYRGMVAADVVCPCGQRMTVIGCCIQTGRPIRWCGACGAIKTCEAEEAIQPAGGLARAIRIISREIEEMRGKTWYHPEHSLQALLNNITQEQP